MPRRKRIIYPELCYHVLIKGNDGRDIFRDDADRSWFCLLLQYASEKHRLIIHGFCLMTNHVHLLLQPENPDLSSGMHALSFRYAQYFNRKYQQRGYLFQGRFKAIPVQSGTYLRRLVRYIHLNPIRAHLARAPEQYRWSSHSAYMEQSSYTWLQQNLVLKAFADRSRLLKYITLANSETRDELIEIRHALQAGAYGDADFLASHRSNSANKATSSECHLKSCISIEEFVNRICDEMQVPLEAVQSTRRQQNLVKARAAMAILLNQLKLGSMTALGKIIQRDPTSLGRLVSKGDKDPALRKLATELTERFQTSASPIDENS